MIRFVGVLVLAYLLGAIPFGYLAGLLKGQDIRKSGSGNIGATNVARVLGLRWAALVFGLDVAKGLVPTVLAGAWLPGEVGATSGSATFHAMWLAVGLACIAGHTCSVFLRFRGGKGVATSLGVVLGVYPQLCMPGLIGLAVWLGIVAVSRTVSLASVCAAAVFPLAVVGGLVVRDAPIGSEWPFVVFGVVVALLVVVRHRENLSRLRAGTERLIGQSRRDERLV